MIVVDASVFNKLFLNEPDRSHAVALFQHCLEEEVDFGAPALLTYEAMSAAVRFGLELSDVWRLLDAQRLAGFRLVEPTVDELELAGRIASTGHAKSGYPHLYDSIYHAIAIKCGGTFVTADARHFAKARQFGNICLLADWQP